MIKNKLKLSRPFLFNANIKFDFHDFHFLLNFVNFSFYSLRVSSVNEFLTKYIFCFRKRKKRECLKRKLMRIIDNGK